MRSGASAWVVALVALAVAVLPLAAMGGMLGLSPMSTATANLFWSAAIVLTIVAFVLSIRLGMRTRA